MAKMKAFNVWSRVTDTLIDTVFYDERMTELEVRKSLIEHDGYEYSIIVIKERKDGSFRNYETRNF
jgi:hypothetical protein